MNNQIVLFQESEEEKKKRMENGRQDDGVMAIM